MTTVSTAVTEPTDTAVPQEAFELRESTVPLSRDAVTMPTELAEAYSDTMRAKMVPLHIIRPGLGKGRGRHLYEAKMLEENAHKFRGWKMYVDHLSPEARRAAGGLPRSVRDLGGRVVESYWDPNVPADPDKGHDQGAVVGWAIPTPFVRELVDNDPEIVEASISSNATGVHPVKFAGQRAWCVEGIEDRGSVDWVTEAGAGGRVVALMESAYTEENMALLEGMDDDEFVAWVREQRPHLVVEESPAPPAKDGEEDDELEKTIAALVKKGLPRAAAEKAAKKKLAEALDASVVETGEDMAELTPQALQEALQDEGFRDAFNKMVDERADAKLQEAKTATEESQKALIEAAIAEERDLFRAEARADAQRSIELRDMRDAAGALVEAAKLPEAFAKNVRGRFTLTEAGEPTAELDVTDDVDDDGKVTKTARAKLAEAVETVIEEQRTLLAAANPTRIRGLGPQSARKGGEAAETRKGEGTLWGSMLQEAGVDPETAYASASA